MLDPVLVMIREKIGLATALAVAVALAGAFLLWRNYTEPAILNGIEGAYTATWVCTAVGTAFAAMSLGFQAIGWIKRKGAEIWTAQKAKERQQGHERTVLALLDTLSPEEEQTLAWLLQNNRKSLIGERGTRVLHSLQVKGLLLPATGEGEVFNWPFLPPEFVWLELQRQRERFMAVRIQGPGLPWRIHWMQR
jgi:hypothetical protein